MEYEFSNQACSALMLALQKSLMEQSDIVPVLRNFKLTNTDDGLVVENPPILDFREEKEESEDSA